ncbi:MAG: M48 family metallopeptidase [Gemmataceae bacterium]
MRGLGMSTLAAVTAAIDPDQELWQWLDRPLQIAKILGWCALIFTVFYAIVMAAMALTGLLLARRTRGPIETELQAAHHAPQPMRGQTYRTQAETSLARWYALALLAGLLFFYLALPFVLFGLLVVVLITMVTLGGRGYRDDLGSHLLRAGGGGMSAVMKALFARSGTAGLGVRKQRTQCPKLFAAIDEVAARVETEPPDEVWIAPGAEFSVCQRGRGPFGVFGGSRRVLTLGLCVLHFLTESEFKSILAHEFAHFSHADTYWHRFIYQVTLSLRTALGEMARTGGWVTWINPFYWFFWLYSRSYSLLAAGFSRSREFLADRMACSHYGSDVFATALEKVCIDGGQFEKVIYKNIAGLLAKNQAFVNMYLAFRKFHEERGVERQQRLAVLLEETPSLFDSHPTYTQRLTAAQLLPRAAQQDRNSALQLFDNSEQVEQELTDYLTHALASRLRL